MKCPKCKNEVRNDIHICPHCGTLVNTEKKNETIKTVKKAKSTIVDKNMNSLTGVSVSKESFITLQKSPTKKKEILRKDYNNYIDYKEAKERALEEQQNKTSSKSLLSNIIKIEKINEAGTVSGRARAVRKSPKTNEKEFKIIDKEKAINPLITENFAKKKKTSKNKTGAIKIEKVTKKSKYNIFNKIITASIFIIWLFTVYYLVTKPDLNYYFHQNDGNLISSGNTDNTIADEELSQYQGVSKSGQNGGYTSNGVTAIVYDNQYLKQFNINNENTVYKLIATDSIKQKTNCPSRITQIENDIINTYGITAINFCEMDEEFAEELKNVIKYIFNTYPQARYYLTNITLANVEDNLTYMAAFMPIFTFATSNTNTGYPTAVKTQIVLNAKYFLDPNKIKSSVLYGSKSGYFPLNATRSSALAHEFGHYLSYVALLNHYNTGRLNFVKASESKLLYDIYQDFNEGTYSYSILLEAYNKYHEKYPADSFEEFRSSISKYAIAKDGYGNYIYDETIAEAFHDVYLNGNSAAIASQYIMDVLLSKL